MKRHTLVPLVVAFGVGIIALGGPKFWEKKDFSDWSKKEIKQMLTKSPWARSVTIRLGGLQTSGPQAAGGGPGGLAGGGAGNTQGGEPPVGGGGSYNPGGASLGGGGRGGPPPSLSATVRWYSALPVKQALAAHRYGSEAQEDEDLKSEETHYTIGLSGSGLSGVLFSDQNIPKSETEQDPWVALTERLKSDSILKISGREPIQAVEIRIRNAPELDVVDAGEASVSAELLVMFPRSQTITLEDKTVEFVTRLGRQKLKKGFKLKEMVYKGELEL